MRSQEGVSALAAAGIPIWIDARARVAHEKALIIDRRVTIMCSYNWSKGAASNSEDLNVVRSSEVAETYAKHWQARQAFSIRFADASLARQRYVRPKAAVQRGASDALPGSG